MVRLRYVNINLVKMPFKTKRQKLKAAARRYTFSESKPVEYKTGSQVSTISQSLVKNPETKEQHLPTLPSQGRIEENVSQVKIDLLRITALAFLICISQLLIFLYKDKLPLPF